MMNNYVMVNRLCRSLLRSAAVATKNQNSSSVWNKGWKAFGTIPQTHFTADFFFRQLFDRTSCTFTYVLGDVISREAILIDPVIEHSERDIKLIKELGLKLKYCLNTHVHADHITGTGHLKQMEPDCKSVLAKYSGGKADIKVEHGDKIKMGKHELEVRATPGHTDGCVSFVSHRQSCVFTGDALLVRGCGRTDFQEGDPSKLYDSIWNQLLTLPDDYFIFPAHDYFGHSASSIYEEKKFNPRLTKSKEDFIVLMNNLKLPHPAKIDVSLPANMVCGLYDLPEDVKKFIK